MHAGGSDEANMQPKYSPGSKSWRQEGVSCIGICQAIFFVCVSFTLDTCISIVLLTHITQKIWPRWWSWGNVFVVVKLFLLLFQTVNQLNVCHWILLLVPSEFMVLFEGQRSISCMLVKRYPSTVDIWHITNSHTSCATSIIQVHHEHGTNHYPVYLEHGASSCPSMWMHKKLGTMPTS